MILAEREKERERESEQKAMVTTHANSPTVCSLTGDLSLCLNYSILNATMQSGDHKLNYHHADNECLLDVNSYTDEKLDAAQRLYYSKIMLRYILLLL